MSARTQLVEQLREVLPAGYVVVGSPDCPDQIEPGTRAVRAWASGVEPGTESRALRVDMTVWVLTPKTKPGETDDDLDEAFDDVYAALIPMKWLLPAKAERAVMDDNDGPRWHGWRFTTAALGSIDLTED